MKYGVTPGPHGEAITNLFPQAPPNKSLAASTLPQIAHRAMTYQFFSHKLVSAASSQTALYYECCCSFHAESHGMVFGRLVIKA